MLRFSRRLAIALAVGVALCNGTPSLAEPRNAPPRKPPRNPPDNGPRPSPPPPDRGWPPGESPPDGGSADQEGSSRDPGLRARGDEFYYSSRGTAHLDILANDEYPPGAVLSYDSAGYAYLSDTRCPGSDRICLLYEPVEGERPYPDRIPYELRDPGGGRSHAEAYVHMP